MDVTACCAIKSSFWASVSCVLSWSWVMRYICKNMPRSGDQIICPLALGSTVIVIGIGSFYRYAVSNRNASGYRDIRGKRSRSSKVSECNNERSRVIGCADGSCCLICPYGRDDILLRHIRNRYERARFNAGESRSRCC